MENITQSPPGGLTEFNQLIHRDYIYYPNIEDE